MRIAIDARWIFPEISGVGAYTRELISQLARLDRENEYCLLFSDEVLRDRTREETGLSNAANFGSIIVPWGIFSAAGQFGFPGLLRRERIDVFHSTNYMIPLPAFRKRARRGARCVVTIHDVIPLLLPEHAPRSRKSRVLPLYRGLMKSIGARADAIITDSRASAADIARVLDIPGESADKIHAIYCGVSPRFTPAAPHVRDSETRRLLFVGRVDPYKNLALLVEALADACAKLPFPVNLTVAGSPDPRYPEAMQLAGRLGIEDRIHWAGYIDDDALVRLYQESDLLVHPSRYEGFGLQVAEAMACGTPVVCSTGGSLPEVAGDAAILVDPDDRAGLTASIITVLEDPRQAASMIDRGLGQAARFTWEKTATDTLEVYRDLGPRGGRDA